MNAFLTHHRWHHNGITTKEYYDKYLKKNDEGICETPNCNNICNFYSLTKGYNKHCSRECTKKDPVIKKKFGNGIQNIEKIKQTCLKKYGVENISQLKVIKEKKKQTCLKNNGYEYWVGTNEHKEWMRNGGAAYCNMFIKNPSKPQIKFYKKVLKLCPYAILNYPCLNYSIDIAIPFLEVAIEYDEPYWHNEIYDKKRDKKLKENGWNVFRFSKTIPTAEEIKKILNRSTRVCR